MLLLLAACADQKIDLSDVSSADEVTEACEQYTPETVTLEVVFPAQTESCPWGEGDNLDPEGGLLTARVEQTQALTLPTDAIICDLAFDFSGLVPDEVQVMRYDDHFFFTFNDLVLASSLAVAVDELPGELPTWDWSALAGFDYHATGWEYEPYCLGAEAGDTTCEIPETETEGTMNLSFPDALVAELSAAAIEAGRYDFAFVTTGDDDADRDCRHAEFGFTVEVPYLAP